MNDTDEEKGLLLKKNGDSIYGIEEFKLGQSFLGRSRAKTEGRRR